jgi:Flp pilus assembly protein TadD
MAIPHNTKNPLHKTGEAASNERRAMESTPVEFAGQKPYVSERSESPPPLSEKGGSLSPFDLGKHNLTLQNYSAAREHFLEEITRRPDNGEAHHCLGVCEAEISRDERNGLSSIHLAKKHFELAIEHGFDESKVHLNLGMAYHLLGDFQSAADCFSRAINRGDKSPTTLHFRGMAYFGLAQAVLKEANAIKAKREEPSASLIVENVKFATLASNDLRKARDLAKGNEAAEEQMGRYYIEVYGMCVSQRPGPLEPKIGAAVAAEEARIRSL